LVDTLSCDIHHYRMLNVLAVDRAILQIAHGHVTIRLHLWAHAYSKRCTRLLCVMGKCTIELLFNMLLPWVIVVCRLTNYELLR